MTSDERTRRDAMATNLSVRLHSDRRTVSELAVVDEVLSGLERGADVYGPLDIGADGRDWEREACDELRDMLVYLAAVKIADRSKRSTAAGHGAQRDAATGGLAPHETPSGGASHEQERP